jgi:hypothetical protein
VAAAVNGTTITSATTPPTASRGQVAGESIQMASAWGSAARAFDSSSPTMPISTASPSTGK